MIVPGSSYWNIGIGLAPGDVNSDDEGIMTMRTLGVNMAWLMKKTGRIIHSHFPVSGPFFDRYTATSPCRLMTIHIISKNRYHSSVSVMKSYQQQYRRKLTSPDHAMEQVTSGDTVVYGMSIAQPPALLAALAARARQGDVNGLKVYTFLPRDPAAKTVLSPDLADTIENYSWFVGAADRDSVKVGLNYHVPSYLHQIPQTVSGVHGYRCGDGNRFADGQGGFLQPRDCKRLLLNCRPHLQERSSLK